MGDKYKQFCVVFYTHEPFSYKYFDVLILSHANRSSDALNCQVHHSHNEKLCEMHDFIQLGNANISYIYFIKTQQ
jgi:hypothetical protein